MMRYFLIAFIYVLCITSSYAEVGKGLAEEFTILENRLRNPQLSENQKKKIFELSMIGSVRSSLSKRLVNPKKDLVSLSFQDLQTERYESSNSYYVKYKNYYFFYTFPVDPNTYVTFPVEEILLEKKDGMDLSSSAHKEEGSK